MTTPSLSRLVWFTMFVLTGVVLTWFAGSLPMFGFMLVQVGFIVFLTTDTREMGKMWWSPLTKRQNATAMIAMLAYTVAYICLTGNDAGQENATLIGLNTMRIIFTAVMAILVAGSWTHWRRIRNQTAS